MHVAVLGIGVLGRAVAERLYRTGHTVTVYNRTRLKAQSLQPLGITVAATPSDALGTTDCALLFLTDAAAIRSVLLNGGVTLAGRTIIQMGTIGPEESRDLQNAIVSAGGDYFEAPVLGSLDEAKAGTLIVMAGGTEEQFQRVAPVLKSISSAPRLVGPIGHAATLKLALNQLIASETAAFALSLALIRQSQVPVELFMAILKESALYARTFDKKLPRLEARDYAQPNFSTRHLLKDVELFLAAAQERGLRAAGLPELRNVLADAVVHGYGDADYSAMYEEISSRGEPKEAT